MAEVADLHGHTLIAQRLKFVEIGIAFVAVAGFWMHSVFVLFVALFLFGVIGALFGPIKYGILPDHLARSELPAGNALVEGATFIAILLGTIVGGLAALNAAHAGHIGSLGAVVLVLIRAGTYGQQAQGAYQYVRQALPYVERLAEIERRYKQSSPRSGNRQLDGVRSVGFEVVSFAYEPSRPALRHISFKLLAGTSAAIIGPSGAGKTTLLNLLPRFFDPSSGAVLLEGVDLRDLRLEDLRAQVGLVLQKPIILPTTVAENIAYGKPHATMAEIEAAAHYANASAFIEKLPQQYQTAIGDGGARLSVGEKQRINLARAFLKDAPILLMDEPTSALDVESEAQVVASLFALMRGRTTLMVAHRLTTIRRVDKILVVENGRLTEMGGPDDLLAQQGYYARVVSGQLEL